MSYISRHRVARITDERLNGLKETLPGLSFPLTGTKQEAIDYLKASVNDRLPTQDCVLDVVTAELVDEVWEISFKILD